jgi:hypothetical protein
MGVLRFLLRVLKILFVLGLVMMPVPIAIFFIQRPDRRNLPAMVLKKK